MCTAPKISAPPAPTPPPAPVERKQAKDANVQRKQAVSQNQGVRSTILGGRNQSNQSTILGGTGVGAAPIQFKRLTGQ